MSRAALQAAATRKMVSGVRVFCCPRNAPWHEFMTIMAGAERLRMRRYGSAVGIVAGVAPMSVSRRSPKSAQPAVQATPQHAAERTAWLCRRCDTPMRRFFSASVMDGAPGELEASTLVTATPMNVKTCAGVREWR